MVTALKFLCIVICGYLLGCVSLGRLFARINKFDLAKEGSGNPGTANMLRNHGFVLGIGTLLFDTFKGAAATLIGIALFNGFQASTLVSNLAGYLGGFMTAIGHCYPVFYGFKGGKGIAVAFGMFLVFEPLIAFLTFLVLLVAFMFIKIASVVNLTFVTVMTGVETYRLISAFGTEALYALSILYILLALLFYWHRANIKRLIEGTENKFDFKKISKKDKELVNKISKKNSDNEQPEVVIEPETETSAQDDEAEEIVIENVDQNNNENTSNK